MMHQRDEDRETIAELRAEVEELSGLLEDPENDSRARRLYRDNQHLRAVAKRWESLYREAVGIPPTEHAARRLEAMAQKVESAEAEVERLRELARIGVELDNHHNAAVCPYCTPALLSPSPAATTGEAEGKPCGHHPDLICGCGVMPNPVTNPSEGARAFLQGIAWRTPRECDEVECRERRSDGTDCCGNPAAVSSAEAALCDGCDNVTTGVVATDDGRAQMCPDCLPIANAPRREVWGISYGPTVPVRVHPSEESARAAAADVTRGGEVVAFRGGNAWEPAPCPVDCGRHVAHCLNCGRGMNPGDTMCCPGGGE